MTVRQVFCKKCLVAVSSDEPLHRLIFKSHPRKLEKQIHSSNRPTYNIITQSRHTRHHSRQRNTETLPYIARIPSLSKNSRSTDTVYHSCSWLICSVNRRIRPASRSDGVLEGSGDPAGSGLLMAVLTGRTFASATKRSRSARSSDSCDSNVWRVWVTAVWRRSLSRARA